jgi:hypothetical protein
MRFTQFPERQLRFGLFMDTGKLITLANGTVAVILANTATVVARQVHLGEARRLSAESKIALALPYGLIGLLSSIAPGAAWTKQQRQATGARNSLRQSDRIVRATQFLLNRSWSCS